LVLLLLTELMYRPFHRLPEVVVGQLSGRIVAFLAGLTLELIVDGPFRNVWRYRNLKLVHPAPHDSAHFWTIRLLALFRRITYVKTIPVMKAAGIRIADNGTIVGSTWTGGAELVTLAAIFAI